jgi:transcriptional regulator with XRE-family HTH domain
LSHDLVKIVTMSFAKRLEKLRDKKGLSNRGLAKRLGNVSGNTVGRWIKGDIEPRLDEVRRVEEFFGVQLVVFLAEGEEAIPEGELNEDERYLLRVMRGMGLDFEEVIRRLVSCPLEAPRSEEDQPGSGGVVRVRDRRKQDNGDSPGVGHAEDPVPGRPDDPVPRRRGK